MVNFRNIGKIEPTYCVTEMHAERVLTRIPQFVF